MAESPRRSAARSSSQKKIPVGEAKRLVLDAIAGGATRDEAMRRVSRTVETYRSWMKDDAEFKAEIERLRVARETGETLRRPVPDFEEFCRDYLHEPMFPHMLRGVDALEGRVPRDLHPSMTFEPGKKGRFLINFPPNHAKTTAFSINYCVWRIHQDPNVKIAVISKSQGFAKKILGAIKMRLTSNAYREMHLAFAPEGGWRDKDQSWSATQIYVQGKGDGEKDPTVEAVGLGGQIYGGRFDIIICDDVIDNENAHRYEDHVDWLMTILDSRLPPGGGLLMVLGTRIAATDLYSELRKARDISGRQFFTYLAQPAVLDYGSGESRDWVTLWPYTNCAENDDEEPDGSEYQRPHLRCLTCIAREGECECESPRLVWMKTRWNGQRLAAKRFPMGERKWSLVWQQQQIPDDATFNHRAVEASINRARKSGVMTGGLGHRQAGMTGLYVVGGLDPATVGNTAMIVTGIDRLTQKRYLLDGFNRAGTSPQTMRETIQRLTDTYRINEWVIERNAFQRFLTQDPQLRSFLQSRGCKLTEHYTTSNKVDPDFGVMSLAPLFESCGVPPEGGSAGLWKRTPDKALIELPSDVSGWVSDLVKQLITWEPSGLSQGQKTDLVMALWFCEIAAQRILGLGRKRPSHLDNPFASRAALKQRAVINLREFQEAALAAG